MNERCINDSCGRAFPRAVAFCPYCGTAQNAAARAQAGARLAAAVPQPAAAAVPVAAPAAPPAAPPVAAFAAAAPPAPAAAPVPPAPARPRLKFNFGRKPLRIPELEPGISNRPAPAVGPRPIRASTWLLILLVLAAIWMLAKPRGSKEMAQRVEAAVAMTSACQLDDARTELILLRERKASEAQLGRLQSAIGKAAPACEKKRLREKAWSDASAAVESALAANHGERAASRLASFTKRWGEDAASRDLSERVATRRAEILLEQAEACLGKGDRACLESRLAAVEQLQRPALAARIAGLRESLSRLLEATLLGGPDTGAARDETPAVLVSRRPNVISTNPAPGESAASLLAAARRDIERGNYRGALNKIDQCLTVADPANRNCQNLKTHTERLNREMLRCAGNGGAWVNGGCQ